MKSGLSGVYDQRPGRKLGPYCPYVYVIRIDACVCTSRRLSVHYMTSDCRLMISWEIVPPPLPPAPAPGTGEFILLFRQFPNMCLCDGARIRERD